PLRAGKDPFRGELAAARGPAHHLVAALRQVEPGPARRVRLGGERARSRTPGRDLRVLVVRQSGAGRDLRRQWMGSTVAPVKDWTIDATTIRAAAQLANASTTDVQRVALGLPPAVGHRGRIFEALVAAGADRGLLERLARSLTAKETTA